MSNIYSYMFYGPLRVIINLINPQIHFISDLAAQNVYFESRQLLLTPAITFQPRFGASKLLIRPETGVKSLADFHLPFFFAINFILK